MTKSNITEYDKVAANNTDVQDVPLGENQMYPSDVNNAFREVMADLAAVNDGTVSLTSPSFAAASLTGNLSFGDNNRAIFGAGPNLQIYYDGTNSTINDTGSGNLSLITNGSKIGFYDQANTQFLAEFFTGAGIRLYYDGSQKFVTQPNGIDVTGTVMADGGEFTGDVTFGDSDKAIFGAGSDLQIYHDGSHSNIKDAGTGNLRLQGDNLVLQNSDATKNYAVAVNGGAIDLRHNNSVKLATTSTGIDVTGDATFGDNDKAIFGAGSDLQIYHDGGHSYITDAGQGDLRISGSSLVDIKCGDDIMFRATEGGSTQLRYDGSQKLATTSTGINVTGTVTADGLTVDSSGTIRLNHATADDFLTITQGGTQAVITAGSAAGAANLLFKTTAAGVDTNAMQLFSNNDISFYEDTGTTAKLFWDASAERLGLGTSSPSYDLNIKSRNTTEDGIFIQSSGSDNYGLYIKTAFASTMASVGALNQSDGTRAGASIDFVDFGRQIAFATNAGASKAERARLDSSGNFMVGKTSVGVATTGSEIRASGQVSIVRESATPLYVNRKNTDGPIIDVRKDNTTVGLIGAAIGNAYFAGSSTGITFGSANVYPTNSSGTKSSNVLTLGSASNRFKDLYLGGTANAVTINTDGPTGTGNGIVMAASGWPYKGRIGMNGTSGGKQYWTANYNLNTSSVDSASYYSTYIENSAQNGVIAFGISSAANTAPSERVRITSAGLVGIGTSSPSEELTIRASVPKIQIEDSDGTNQYGQFYHSAGITSILARNNTSDGTIVFQKYDGTTTDETMRIDSAGRVGIGTSSPATALDVNGTVTADNVNPSIITVGVGKFTGDGTSSNASGISYSRTATGSYTISFSTARPDADYIVTAQVVEASPDLDSVVIHVIDGTQATTGFDVKIHEGDNGTSPGTLRDRDFYIVVHDIV